MFDLIPQAYAQSGGVQQGSPMGSLLFLGVLFVVFYFLLILPQQKRQKAHRLLIAGLNVGDEIVTGGGLVGRIKQVDDQFADVEIAAGVAVKIQKHTVASVLPKGTVKFS